MVDFQLHIKSHMTLAFMPIADVITFADQLHAMYCSDTNVKEFHSYFRATWLNGQFQIALWNLYGVNHVHRTNNVVESQDVRFNRIVRSAPRSVYTLILHVQREECHTMAIIDQSKLGFMPAHSKSKYDQLHERIQKLYESHLHRSISTAELMNKSRHLIHIFH